MAISIKTVKFCYKKATFYIYRDYDYAKGIPLVNSNKYNFYHAGQSNCLARRVDFTVVYIN
jgi:hypothetical protein